MIEPEKRKFLYDLYKDGMSKRKIASQFGVSRETLDRIVQEGGAAPERRWKLKIPLDPELLRRLYEECDGFKQRVYERLLEEEGIQVSYPTVTRRLRELGLGREGRPRCDRVPDEPGAEMQHDTSVCVVDLGGELTQLVASLLYLRYSKRRYLKFYHGFNRFKMKCFFHEALTYWGYTARICVIDNTSLARLRGTGANAVIVPEMAAFAAQYGFEFLCHEKGHSNRKAGEERGFRTVETNFLPGRKFRDDEDLNAQAFEWSTVRMEHRPLTKARLIPAKAFEHERAYLVRVPEGLPAPYLVHERSIDQYGYVAFAGNFYWVPGTERGDVRVLEYAERLEIYRGRELLQTYALPVHGVKNQRFSPEGLPRPRREPKNRKDRSAEEEKRLRALGPVVGAYLDSPWTPRGKARPRFLRELFALSEQMSAALFLQVLERALKYRIDSTETIRRIALMYVREGTDMLPRAELDESFLEREAYLEGRLTDEPDFSRYSDSEEEDG